MSKNACSFSEMPGHISNPPKYYKKRRDEFSATYNCSTEPGQSCSVSYWDEQTFNLECQNIETSGGPNERNVFHPDNCSSDEPGAGGGCSDAWENPGSSTITSNSRILTANRIFFSGSGSGIRTNTLTLSEEITTGLLISDVKSALGNWPDTFVNSSCNAFRDLSPDENSFTLTEAKYKFVADEEIPTGKKLTVTYQIRHTAEGGGDVITGPNTVDITAGNSESSEIILSPTEDGTETIEYLSHECINT